MEKLGSNLPAEHNSAYGPDRFDCTIKPFDAKRHVVAEFHCDVDALDNYIIKGQLRDDQGRRVTRAFVCVRESDPRVIGYYCINATSIAKNDFPDARKLPSYPVFPAVLLGKLAVHKEMQRQGIGKDLLLDALLRTLECSRHMGILAFIVEAFDKDANDFYIKHGFKQYDLPNQEGAYSRLFILMKDVEKMKLDIAS